MTLSPPPTIPTSRRMIIARAIRKEIEHDGPCAITAMIAAAKASGATLQETVTVFHDMVHINPPEPAQ